MSAIIEIKNATKTFRRQVHALRSVTMRVNKGQIFCLLGPNGAGKSTLVKILMTIVRPTSIDGSMLGHTIGHKPTLRKVGYLPEHHRFPLYLTANQALHYYGGLQGMPRKRRVARIAEMLDLVGMSAWGGHRIGTFSKGMQQRIGLAQALLHEPEVLLLDEPTDGVDPVGRRDIRKLLTRLRDEGHTILINSHILAELEDVCDQLAVLVKGQVAMEGTIDELTAGHEFWQIRYQGNAPSLDELDIQASDEDGVIKMTGVGVNDVQPIIDRLRSAGCIIESVYEQRETLEELFMRALAIAESDDASTPGAVRGKNT
ncbi:MAG: ABC transporter ATP-binding protein [Phycisphaerales bacterium]|nr:ABC transporter ATP-binding protein [Phycisphaerales bacterium]